MEPKNELHRNAIASARRQELTSFQRALDVQWMNNRMEDSRMARCLAVVQREADLEKDFQEKTDHAALVNAKVAKEMALGTEIAKVTHDEACEYLRRHYLRERDPELRELIRKLQAGYVCRDLKQQILHNEYRRLQEKTEEKRVNQRLSNALFSDEAAEEHEEKLKLDRTMQYRKELQQQLVNKQRQKQCEYEELLIEKKTLDDIMRALADEDKKEIQQKQEMMQKTRNEMITFKKAHEAWKEKQKMMLVKEEEAIERQQKAAADRTSSILAERQKVLEAKEDINKRICAKIQLDEQERLDKEELIRMLQEQEYIEKNIQGDIAAKEKSERVKKEILEVLTNQMERRKRQEKEQKETEAILRKQAEEKKVVDDAADNEKERRRKEKNRQHSVDLLRQIEDNDSRRKAGRRAEEGGAQYVWDCYGNWCGEVADERKKILEEHAPHLLGHLQVGVLKREDLPVVKAGAEKHEDLAKLDIEGMAVSNRPQRFPKCNPQCMVLRKY